MPVRVFQERCPQSHTCPAIRVCPVQALSQKGNAAPTVDRDKCTDCGACVDACVMGALRLE